jgi:hypothetical protein
MAKILNKLRGNGHWTSAYMPLQENLGGEARKGVLIGGLKGELYLYVKPTLRVDPHFHILTLI